MKSEDPQIEVLLRRYGTRASGGAAAGHLDADELSAFAEGALPPAARSRYVSHLAECADCRKLATQLTLAAGAGTISEAAAPEVDGSSWRQKLASFFAPPTLRYAAFAAVLVVAASVTFVALRNRSQSRLLAQNESANEKQISAARESQASAPIQNQEPQANASPSGTISQPGQNLNLDSKQDGSKVAENSVAPPKPEKEAAPLTSNPVLAGKKTEPASTEASPSFAPLPPGDAQSRRARTDEPREERRVADASEPRQSQSDDKLKTMNQSRAGELSKDQRTGGPNNRAANNQQSTTQNSETKAESPQPLFRAGRDTDEAGVAASRKESAGTGRAEADKPSETRSVGGLTFRKQGNTWVDSKYKSSMSLTSIARGSDDFQALDSSLRSIADRLGGEVIVVSHGKAYRIH